ncbi:flagellar hook protein FlgE [Frigidibacter oleivorans]|uniref:flagellar hook protein FlgE n=1 Tax=Frigidibacter oleivorans TaxID=2487129 RepID=UPI000F8D8EC8|nr:flagellar hook protein FlgE [Frigidibacter oleivorans]
MSMNTALSGLNAAQTDISATSNNIANVSTVGFRGSRTEFADIFNTSPYSVSATTTGSGTQVTRVAQDFSQGSIVSTGNQLDLAIEGTGFFALQQTGTGTSAETEILYSRAGAFSMSSDGTIVNASGQALLGWPVARDGEVLNQAMPNAMPMAVPLSMGEPVATATVTLDVALPTDGAMAGAQDAVPPSLGFDPADATTWAHRTPVPAFDADGNAVEAEVYFVRVAEPDLLSEDTTYALHYFQGGMEYTPATGNTLTFGADGLPTGATDLAFTGAGAGAGTITLALGDSALEDGAFEVASVSQDGAVATPLTKLSIDDDGTIWATYGGEDSLAVGKLMLVTFPNPGGLMITGNASFAATADSGDPISGLPGTEGFGLLRAGALEQANVDLTEELVSLITAQRNYQASAKAMETSSTMMQTILNMRN